MNSMIERVALMSRQTIYPNHTEVFPNGTIITLPPDHYGYAPTEWVCALFVALYALSACIHLGQAVRYRMWWLIPTAVLAGLGEVLGWSGRLWSSRNLPLNTPFLIQISCTIISPTPLLAANFVILGIIINTLGDHYSRLPTRWYIIVFCTFDVISLVVQAVGGGIASGATTTQGTNNGGHIMLGGIVFQLFSLIIYASCATEFFWRFLSDKPIRQASSSQPKMTLSPPVKMMIFGLIFSTTCLFIRAVYRTAELSDGWQGRIIHTQIYFNVLDGGMVTLAIYTLNLIHPGRLLQDYDPATEKAVNRNSDEV